jgi:hypothetical protein
MLLDCTSQEFTQRFVNQSPDFRRHVRGLLGSVHGQKLLSRNTAIFQDHGCSHVMIEGIPIL